MGQASYNPINALKEASERQKVFCKHVELNVPQPTGSHPMFGHQVQWEGQVCTPSNSIIHSAYSTPTSWVVVQTIHCHCHLSTSLYVTGVLPVAVLRYPAVPMTSSMCSALLCHLLYSPVRRAGSNVDSPCQVMHPNSAEADDMCRFLGIHVLHQSMMAYGVQRLGWCHSLVCYFIRTRLPSREGAQQVVLSSAKLAR